MMRYDKAALRKAIVDIGYAAASAGIMNYLIEDATIDRADIDTLLRIARERGIDPSKYLIDEEDW